MPIEMDEAMPAVTAERSQTQSDPDYVIQCYFPLGRDWRNWDCAYTRTEANKLLTVYERRHREMGLNWRIARIVYPEPEAAESEALAGLSLADSCSGCVGARAEPH